MRSDPGSTSVSPFDLTGRRALVTGSTRGIGAAVAEALARAGAAVTVHGRSQPAAEHAATSLGRRLRADGLEPQLGAIAFDISDSDAVVHAAQMHRELFGQVDILVNNAGIQFRSPVLDFPLDAWQHVVQANLTCCLQLAQQVAPGMIERGSGKIINICSVQSRMVKPMTAAYAVTKAGLATLGQVMCADWARHGLQINGIAPGFIATDMTAGMRDPAKADWVVGRTPAGRWGTPEDLSGTAVWLASSASDFVNGQTVFVDGGMTAAL